MEGDEENEFVQSKSKICSDRAKCTARKSWCKETFSPNVPADCLEQFAEQCCGTVAVDALEECKAEVSEWKVLEEPFNPYPDGCFDQAIVSGDKNKNDSCAACCTDQIDEACYTESSRLGCVSKCNSAFPFETAIATQASSNDENST